MDGSLAARDRHRSGRCLLEQFQQKCVAVLRPELRENKEIEHFRDSEKSGNALEPRAHAGVKQ
ncbi:hypothetical protein E0H35_31080 [Rhizobium leguminosarum bv. viciae]|uniref:Uncharacterized protein n=1 Tax=Rhizobium leguminosarum bv. viciae TaxID=387 RepID=A0A8G2ISW5_RHILV|nr:hypothetical protein [Rhizobium leguminosarum bv. viciae]NKK21321.1 hypothetical protein [Rhizobium leguminosarum bv. viciae]NKK51518.1 hypothetical protein [Rhizobium leguminosarum bv. viciae]NKL17712.1 hypothetical protein [Rhizobium leguminosarum bv. viciae]NKL53265.1 hypothetical protein [Rhizobium leguminosarum bv. viciae]